MSGFDAWQTFGLTHFHQTNLPSKMPSASVIAVREPAFHRLPFTASINCFRLKGFGKKPKSSPSGRFFAKASSA
jgi:hypothetical protein